MQDEETTAYASVERLLAELEEARAHERAAARILKVIAESSNEAHNSTIVIHEIK